MKKKSFFSMMLCICMVIYIGGVASGQDTIKLGASYGMTGRIGWIGVDCVDGAKLIIDEVNAKGGIKGSKIELLIHDSKNDPDTARTNFERLIKRDRVTAILGPTVTSESLAVIPIAERSKIPFIVVSGGIKINEGILAEYLKEGKKSYLWALSTGTVRQNEAKVQWLKKKGYKNLGNIEPLDEMGDISAQSYEEFGKKYGINVVAKERFDDKGTDFTTQMAKIKAANADSIGTMASGGPAVILVKNRDQVGLKHVPMMTSDANLSKRFIELLEGHTANVYTVGPTIEAVSYMKDSDPHKKFILDFQKKFIEKYGREPRSWFFASVGYDSALIFIKAIEAVGTDGEKIRDWLENQTRFVGAQAIYSWSKLDHRGIGIDQLFIMRIEGDRWVVAD